MIHRRSFLTGLAASLVGGPTLAAEFRYAWHYLRLNGSIDRFYAGHRAYFFATGGFKG